MSAFAKDPDHNPLETPSGKLEFNSERLAKHFPDDKERPPIPHWVEKSENP
jgi:trimethylamine-N-oxide reductase (cytochrome c)